MNNATLETIKEVGRWILAAAVGWVLTETGKQLGLVPETYDVKVWVFTYTLPVRAGVSFALTLAGRAIDKYVFTTNKDDPFRLVTTVPKGIFPW